MFKRIATHALIVVVALAIGSTLAIAHGDMEHVMGTVAAVTDASVTVNTVQHKTVTVLIDPSTKFDHNNGAGSLSELKVGDRVVIHAKPNKEKKLVAVTVKWGSGGSTAMTHPEHMK